MKLFFKVFLFLLIFVSVSFGSTLNLFSEDSVYPLVKSLSKQYTIKTGIKTNVRLIKSVSSLPYLLKQDIKPNLIFSEDTYILKKNNIKSEPIAIDPIVIVYDKNIKFTDKNWMKVLNKINYGFSNPDSDPLGYYTHFIFNLYNKINKTNYQCKTKYLRDETTDLFWLMKSGNLDAIFTYKSFAVQNHLKYFEPPAPYNLADKNFNYSVVSYKLSNGKVIPGHMSTFGVGILGNDNEFLKFIFSQEKIFNKLGLIPFKK